MTLDGSDKQWIKEEIALQLKSLPQSTKDWIRDEVREQLRKNQ